MTFEAQNILINYQADTEALDDSIDLLEKLGQIDKETADTFRKANKAYRDRSKELKTNTKDQKANNKAVREGNKDVKDLSKSVNGLTRLAKRGAGALAGFFAARQLVQITKGLLDLAVDLDSTQIKFETVFGAAGAEIVDFAEKNASAMGLSVAEYKKATAAAGDLLIPIGFQRKEAATLSNDLVRLSGALAAWTGGQFNASQVAEILTKALLGEREQLKQLGINILDSDVKAQLAAKGLDKLTGASLAQAKAAATLELITLKSKDAQAAFSDETQTLAEKQLELRAEFRTLAEDIATDLIPIYDRLLDTLQSEEFKTFASGLVTVLKGLISFITQAAQGWGILIGAIQDVIDPQRKLTKATWEELQARKESIQAAIDHAEAVIEERGELIAVTRFIKEKRAELLTVNQELLTRVDRGRRFVAQMKEETDALNDETDALGYAIGSLRDLNTQLKEVNKTIASSPDDEDIYIGLVERAVELEEAIDKINNKLDKLREEVTGDFFPDPIDVELNLDRAAFDIAARELFSFDPSDLDIDTSGVEALTDAFWENLAAAPTFTEKLQGRLQVAENLVGEFTNTANAFSANRLARVQADLDAGIISEKEAARLRAQILRREAIFKKVTSGVEVALNTAIAISEAIGNPLRLAQAIIQGALQSAAVAATPIPSVPSFRTGTTSTPPGLIEVGEGGREFMYDPQGGKVVVPNEDVRKIFAKWNIPAVPDPRNIQGFGLPGLSEKQIREIHRTAGRDSMDYDRLGKSVASHLADEFGDLIDVSGSGSSAIAKGVARTNALLTNLTRSKDAYQSRV